MARGVKHGIRAPPQIHTFSNSSLMGCTKVLDTRSAASWPRAMAVAVSGTPKLTMTESVSP